MIKNIKNFFYNKLDYIYLIAVKILCLLPIFGVFIMVWAQQIEWYRKYYIFYSIWYVLSSFITLNLLFY